LNIKGATRGLARAEFEYPEPLEDARALLAEQCAGAIIEKTRHRVRHRGRLWEVDVFSGANEGLVVAEVELSSANERVDLPRWIGVEVSDDPRYRNAALAARPYRDWEEGGPRC
jgi:adenylate cyclase